MILAYKAWDRAPIHLQFKYLMDWSSQAFVYADRDKGP